ncbi:MAG: GNAT family N-acetyltransferase [Actinomycetota bacterium]|nr:GNAT family N-acetyltransferase [Actinomycetota bacterium]
MTAKVTTLANGVTVTIRPIEADDFLALVAFHEHLSFETTYKRFFGVHPHLAPGEAEHFCAVDNHDRFALVATTDDAQLVGVARLERLDLPNIAEAAFVIADQFQRQGLGTVLARELAYAARQLSMTELVADTLADNQAMLRLFPAAGYPVTVKSRDGVARISCPVCQDPLARLAAHQPPGESG